MRASGPGHRLRRSNFACVIFCSLATILTASGQLVPPGPWLPTLTADPTKFRVGVQYIFNTPANADPATSYASWRALVAPLWLTYLQAAVPGVTIEVYPLQIASAEGIAYPGWAAMQVQPRVFDLLVANGLFTECVARELGLRPQASCVVPKLGVPSPFVGLAAITSSPAVQHLSDLQGQAVNIGNPLLDQATVAVTAALVQRGIYLYDEARLIVVASVTAPVVSNSLMGAGFTFLTRTDGINAWNTAIAGVPQLSGLKLILSGPGTNIRIVDAVYYEPSSSLNSTTPFLPEFAISLVAGGNEAVAKLIIGALFALNGTEPQLKSAMGLYDVASVIPVLDYTPVSSLLELTGLATGGTSVCPHTTSLLQDIYSAVQCPPGKVKMSAADIASSCARANISCPSYANICVCPPLCLAIPAEAVATFVTVNAAPTSPLTSNTAPVNATLCGRFLVCATAAQRSAVVLTVVDQMGPKLRAQLSLPPVGLVEILYASSLPGDLSVAPFVRVPASLAANGTWQLPLPLPLSLGLGYWLLFVRVDGFLLLSSPAIIVGTAPVCSGGRVASPDGLCACPAATALTGPLDNACQPVHSIPGVIGGTAGSAVLLVLVLAVVAVCRAQRQARLADSSWLLRPEDVKMDDPPRVLGVGTFGLVLLGTFRETAVAVKLSRNLRSSANVPARRRSRVELIPSRLPSLPEMAVAVKLSRNLRSSANVPPRRRSNVELIPPRLPSLPRNVGPFSPMPPALLSPAVIDHVETGAAIATALRAHAVTGGRRVPGMDLVASSRDLSDATPLALDAGAASRSSRLSVSHTPRSLAVSHLSGRPPPPEAWIHQLEAFQLLVGGALAADPGVISSHLSGRGSFSRNSTSRLSQGSVARASRLPWVVSKWFEINHRDAFLAEIRHLVHLRSPRIVTVLGAVISPGHEPVMVMELMERGSVEDDLLFNPSFAFDAEVVHQVAKDVVAGMAFLHAASPPCLHCDLKPGNVLVDADMRAKVSDFGLSRGESNRGGELAGTPLYMSPEMLAGAPPTRASDVFAFGLLLYQLWTRQELYEGEDSIEVLAAVANTSRRPPKRPWGDTDALPACVPAAFADIIRRCTHPEPAIRPSFAQLATELAQADAGDGYEQRARAKHVLSQVFPPRVAQALREGRPVEPEQHPAVTVFFSDIVGFTVLSQQLAAEEVADLLDRLYQKFDALCVSHGLFKVDTIGDAFMCVGGLPDPQDDHTARVAAFALDAISAARETPVRPGDASLGNVGIRAGFSSGPVVAAVVGRRLPKYTIFGDTVNTASRMESHGQADCVHLSSAAAASLRSQAPVLAASALVCRGMIDVKGKGPMETWFLVNPSVTASVQAVGNDRAGNDRAMADKHDVTLDIDDVMDESPHSNDADKTMSPQPGLEGRSGGLHAFLGEARRPSVEASRLI